MSYSTTTLRITTDWNAGHRQHRQQNRRHRRASWFERSFHKQWLGPVAVPLPKPNPYLNRDTELPPLYSHTTTTLPAQQLRTSAVATTLAALGGDWVLASPASKNAFCKISTSTIRFSNHISSATTTTNGTNSIVINGSSHTTVKMLFGLFQPVYNSHIQFTASPDGRGFTWVAGDARYRNRQPTRSGTAVLANNGRELQVVETGFHCGYHPLSNQGTGNFVHVFRRTSPSALPPIPPTPTPTQAPTQVTTSTTPTPTTALRTAATLGTTTSAVAAQAALPSYDQLSANVAVTASSAPAAPHAMPYRAGAAPPPPYSSSIA